VPDGAQHAFYERHLPEEVHDAASLKSWLQSASPQDRRQLHMTRADLLGPDSEETSLGEFPETIEHGELRLEVAYRFEPGEDDDGLTVTVPQEAVAQLDERCLEWVVPGLLEEKLVALIRSLPKAIRRNLLPAPDTARRAAQMMRFGEGPFLEMVARALSQLAEEPIPRDAFQLDRLPQHLRVNVRVVDEAGEVVAQGRELADLRDRLGISGSQQTGRLSDRRWERDGITRWDFGELREQVEVRRGDFAMAGFPALVDGGDHVRLCLLGSRPAADQATRGGLRRLFCLAERRELRSQVHWLPRLEDLLLFAATLRHAQDLKSQLMDLLAQRAFVDDRPIPRSQDDFEAARIAGRRVLPVVVQDVAALMPPLFEAYHKARCLLEEHASWLSREVAEDVRAQIAALTREPFLVETPWPWLTQYPRYFEAIAMRLEKLRNAGQTRDAQAMAQLRPYLERLEQAVSTSGETGILDEPATEYRWMLEEFRVSLFAQPLGTSIKVSPQRLDRQWAKVTGAAF
jgi:ATP-dependent helicase HrpA